MVVSITLSHNALTNEPTSLPAPADQATSATPAPPAPPPPHPAVEALRAVDPNHLTPMQALELVARLRAQIRTTDA